MRRRFPYLDGGPKVSPRQDLALMSHGLRLEEAHLMTNEHSWW